MTISEIRAALKEIIENESGFPAKRFYDWESFELLNPHSDGPANDWLRAELNGGPMTLESFPQSVGYVARSPLLSLEIATPHGSQTAADRLAQYEDVAERLFSPGIHLAGTLRVRSNFGFDRFREGQYLVVGVSVSLRTLHPRAS